MLLSKCQMTSQPADTLPGSPRRLLPAAADPQSRLYPTSANSFNSRRDDSLHDAPPLERVSNSHELHEDGLGVGGQSACTLRVGRWLCSWAACFSGSAGRAPGMQTLSSVASGSGSSFHASLVTAADARRSNPSAGGRAASAAGPNLAAASTGYSSDSHLGPLPPRQPLPRIPTPLGIPTTSCIPETASTYTITSPDRPSGAAAAHAPDAGAVLPLAPAAAATNHGGSSGSTPSSGNNVRRSPMGCKAGKARYKWVSLATGSAGGGGGGGGGSNPLAVSRTSSVASHTSGGTTTSRPSRWGVLAGILSAGLRSFSQLANIVEPNTGSLTVEALSDLTRRASRLDVVRAVGQVTDLSFVGSGSMGLVYRGRVADAGTRVCVKYIVARGADGMAAPATEGLLSRALAHPNIVVTFSWHVTRVTSENFLDFTDALAAMAAHEARKAAKRARHGPAFGRARRGGSGGAGARRHGASVSAGGAGSSSPLVPVQFDGSCCRSLGAARPSGHGPAVIRADVLTAQMLEIVQASASVGPADRTEGTRPSPGSPMLRPSESFPNRSFTRVRLRNGNPGGGGGSSYYTGAAAMEASSGAAAAAVSTASLAAGIAPATQPPTSTVPVPDRQQQQQQQQQQRVLHHPFSRESAVHAEPVPARLACLRPDLEESWSARRAAVYGADVTSSVLLQAAVPDTTATASVAATTARAINPGAAVTTAAGAVTASGTSGWYSRDSLSSHWFAPSPSASHLQVPVSGFTQPPLRNTTGGGASSAGTTSLNELITNSSPPPPPITMSLPPLLMVATGTPAAAAVATGSTSQGGGGSAASGTPPSAPVSITPPCSRGRAILVRAGSRLQFSTTPTTQPCIPEDTRVLGGGEDGGSLLDIGVSVSCPTTNTTPKGIETPAELVTVAEATPQGGEPAAPAVEEGSRAEGRGQLDSVVGSEDLGFLPSLASSSGRPLCVAAASAALVAPAMAPGAAGYSGRGRGGAAGAGNTAEDAMTRVFEHAPELPSPTSMPRLSDLTYRRGNTSVLVPAPGLLAAAIAAQGRTPSTGQACSSVSRSGAAGGASGVSGCGTGANVGVDPGVGLGQVGMPEIRQAGSHQSSQPIRTGSSTLFTRTTISSKRLSSSTNTVVTNVAQMLVATGGGTGPSGGGGSDGAAVAVAPAAAAPAATATATSGSVVVGSSPSMPGSGPAAASGSSSAGAVNTGGSNVDGSAPPPLPEPVVRQEVLESGWRTLQHIMHRLNAKPGDYLTRIVMEDADRGSLLHAVRSGRFQSTTQDGPALRTLLLTALDIARGMAFLHSHNVIHGDLKPSNVLLCTDRTDPRGFIAKVSDFGLSRIISRGHDSVQNQDPFPGGTVSYMAPETVGGSSFKASDVWSYAVVLWQLVTGEMAPWPGLRNVQIIMGIMQDELRLSVPPCTYPPLAHLIESCLKHNHLLRPSFDDVVQKLQAMLRDSFRSEVTAAQPCGLLIGNSTATATTTLTTATTSAPRPAGALELHSASSGIAPPPPHSAAITAGMHPTSASAGATLTCATAAAVVAVNAASLAHHPLPKSSTASIAASSVAGVVALGTSTGTSASALPALDTVASTAAAGMAAAAATAGAITSTAAAAAAAAAAASPVAAATAILPPTAAASVINGSTGVPSLAPSSADGPALVKPSPRLPDSTAAMTTGAAATNSPQTIVPTLCGSGVGVGVGVVMATVTSASLTGAIAAAASSNQLSGVSSSWANTSTVDQRSTAWHSSTWHLGGSGFGLHHSRQTTRSCGAGVEGLTGGLAQERQVVQELYGRRRGSVCSTGTDDGLAAVVVGTCEHPTSGSLLSNRMGNPGIGVAVPIIGAAGGGIRLPVAAGLGVSGADLVQTLLSPVREEQQPTSSSGYNTVTRGSQAGTSSGIGHSCGNSDRRRMGSSVEGGSSFRSAAFASAAAAAAAAAAGADAGGRLPSMLEEGLIVLGMRDSVPGNQPTEPEVSWQRGAGGQRQWSWQQSHMGSSEEVMWQYGREFKRGEGQDR